MKKNLSSQKRRLSWFLNFINLRIGDQLPNEELFALWAEIRDVGFGEFGSSAIPDHRMLEWDERRGEAIKIQTALKNNLDMILSFQDEGKNLGGTPAGVRRVIRTSQDKGLPYDQGMTPTNSQMDFDYPFKMDFEIRVADGKAFPYSKLQERLLWEFVSALSQFPLDLIKRCARDDCKGYFLKSTKKEKKYCSNRCSWVMAARERRRLNPEKEREKLREIYYEKRRKEIGPDVIIRPRRIIRVDKEKNDGADRNK